MATDPKVFGQDPFHLALFLSPLAELLQQGAGSRLFAGALHGLSQRDVLAQKQREKQEAREEHTRERRLSLRMAAIRAVADDPESAPYWNQLLGEEGAPQLPALPTRRNVLKELQTHEATAKILGQRLPVPEDLADALAAQVGVERPLEPGGIGPAPGQGVASTALRRAPVFVGPEAPQTVEETIGGKTYRLTPSQAARIAAEREGRQSKEPTTEERGEKKAQILLQRVQASNTPAEARATAQGYNQYLDIARRAGAQLPGYEKIDPQEAAAGVTKRHGAAGDAEGRAIRREERAETRAIAREERGTARATENELRDATARAHAAYVKYRSDPSPENKAAWESAAAYRAVREQRNRAPRTEEQRTPVRQAVPARAPARPIKKVDPLGIR